LPTDTLSSVLKIKFFAKYFVLKFYFASIISVRSTILSEKREVSGPLTNGSGSGRPNGSGSLTLLRTVEDGDVSKLAWDLRGPKTGCKTFLVLEAKPFHARPVQLVQQTHHTSLEKKKLLILNVYIKNNQLINF
jgi:hypothetical protein